jgi:fructokinase
VIAEALVVGEALVDIVVEHGRTARHPGGSPANVALGLARLGVPTRLHTAIGGDDDGRYLAAHLKESGVVLTAESVTDAPTSSAVATLAADGSASYDFEVSWAPRPLADLGGPAVIHAGSLAAAIEPGCEVTTDILRRGRAEGSIITFDPNVRRSLLRDPARSRTRSCELAVAAHLTKLSEEDAEFLFPGRPLDEVLDLLVGAGVAVAGITRGGSGAVLASGTERIDVPPVATAVADTVGAGDSFMAAIIHALFDGPGGWDGRPVSAQRLTETGAAAARAAALTVSRPGADLPFLRELA